MINVEQVNIDVSMPTQEIGVVAMQPYLQLQTDNEPFTIQEELVDDQLNKIQRTLDLATSGFNDISAHFTIFPEYSIPGIRGIEMIETSLHSRNWTNNSIILAGIHGLTKAQYQAVFDRFDVTVSAQNNPNNVYHNNWVNACFIWVKDDKGDIRRFMQLKIRPSWEEHNIPSNNMHCGSSIYVFNCLFSHQPPVPCKFTIFICFDWVAPHNGQTVRDEMLENLQGQCDRDISLHWIFVLQHNKSPNHSSFLNSTVEYITDPNKYPLIRRNEASILHLNTAARQKPLKLSNNVKGAFSACVFGPMANFDCNGCRPTVCMQPHRFRGSEILKDAQCRDVVFRERGECVHKFQMKVVRFLGVGAQNRTHPLFAEVHPLDNTTDPRLSGKAIPASVKWFNDSLDEIIPLASQSLNDCELHEEAMKLHDSIVSDLRLNTDGVIVEKKINWARSYVNDGEIADHLHNPDLWDHLNTEESQALMHLVHTITNLRLAYETNIQSTGSHAELNLEDRCIQVMVINGKTYADCRDHYDKNVPKPMNDSVFVVFKTNGNHKPTPEEYSKYYESDLDRVKFRDFQTIVSDCRIADSTEYLKECLDEYLPKDTKII